MKRWTRGREKMSTRRERRTKGRMKTLDKKEEVAKEIWLPILLHPLVDLLTTCEAFVANYFSSKLHHPPHRCYQLAPSDSTSHLHTQCLGLLGCLL